MAYNAFVGGIAPGGLTSDLEVKLLICYLLDSIGHPLSFDTLNEVFQNTGLVNYFEFAESLSELQKTGHVTTELSPEGEEVFAVTESGVVMAQTFEKMVPLSAREKALGELRRLTEAQRCMDKVEITQSPAPDGYILQVVMKDIGSDLLDLKVFLPSSEECLQAKERIEEDPSGFYEALLKGLLGVYGEFPLNPFFCEGPHLRCPPLRSPKWGLGPPHPQERALRPAPRVTFL